VYVSCDPMTLRRDAQQLAAAGYRVDRAHALDMFPHTAQVEAVVRFVRV
jgi:23S rRNA (uracil1939-C5)-methyltransferase